MIAHVGKSQGGTILDMVPARVVSLRHLKSPVVCPDGGEPLGRSLRVKAFGAALAFAVAGHPGPRARRKVLIREIQDFVLTESTFVPAFWRGAYGGHYPWVKNYPGKQPFLFSGRFRWEQVWIDRA